MNSPSPDQPPPSCPFLTLMATIRRRAMEKFRQVARRLKR